MRTEIAKLHERLGATIIYVTHDQTEAMTLGTRIVVMKDGVVQQVDTPQNLYNKPCNRFVASFIGSPQMNFFDAVCVEKDGRAVLKIGSDYIQLPKEKGDALLSGGYKGKQVIMGIRPENVTEAGAEKTENVIEAEVTVYELLGAEVYLYSDVQGSNMIARVAATTKAKVGDRVRFSFDTEKIHVFDKDTEKVITN